MENYVGLHKERERESTSQIHGHFSGNLRQVNFPDVRPVSISISGSRRRTVTPVMRGRWTTRRRRRIEEEEEEEEVEEEEEED